MNLLSQLLILLSVVTTSARAASENAPPVVVQTKPSGASWNVKPAAKDVKLGRGLPDLKVKDQAMTQFVTQLQQQQQQLSQQAKPAVITPVSVALADPSITEDKSLAALKTFILNQADPPVRSYDKSVGDIKLEQNLNAQAAQGGNLSSPSTPSIPINNAPFSSGISTPPSLASVTTYDTSRKAQIGEQKSAATLQNNLSHDSGVVNIDLTAPSQNVSQALPKVPDLGSTIKPSIDISTATNKLSTTQDYDKSVENSPGTSSNSQYQTSSTTAGNIAQFQSESTESTSPASTSGSSQNEFDERSRQVTSTVATTNETTYSSGIAYSPTTSHLALTVAPPTGPIQNVRPLLIYSTRYEIRSYDLSWGSAVKPYGAYGGGSNSALFDQQHFGTKHSSSKTLIGGLKNTVGLDFYYSDNESFIFWTDVIEERIYRGTFVNGSITNIDPVVQSGLATAEGLAIDWVAKNIYWVESTLDHIEVASMNGLARRTLVAGDMESPRAIVLDPRYGIMFWSDWDRSRPRIERASMSGEDRRLLVNIKEVKGGWPNGLTLDYEALKVYWIDANSDSIHVVDYEGHNHRLILHKLKSLGHPFSITLYENNLYWTDWKTNTVSMAGKHNGSEARELQRQSSRPLDIKVFHPSRQPKVDPSINSCSINNGNCSHLCLLTKNNQRRCQCPHLMRMTKSNVTCEPYEQVLLIGRLNEIRAVDISEPLYHVMAPISVPRVFSPKQFEYDAKTRNIFWADSQTNEVKRAQLAGNVIETIIDVIIESPSGLALDWISGNIYVTSAAQHKGSGKILISNLNGEFISVLMDGSQGIVSPKSLAIHPLLGLLFCIDENEKSEPIIFMASMDGQGRRVIASKDMYHYPNLSNPTSLAMDMEANRVYWINQPSSPNETASIQYYDISLEEVRVAVDESEMPPELRLNPSVLCVDGDYLILSGRQPSESIVRVRKNDTLNRMVYKTQNLDQISALRVYNASVQAGTNACKINNGGCSQLCIPTSLLRRTCKCTMGYTPNPQNEAECIGKSEFLIFSYNLGMKGISLKPDSSPDDYYLPPIHRAFRASSIDFVHRDHLIYWVDNEEGSITRINQDTTNYQVIVQGLESEECIAVDWVAGNIYWLDPYYDIIEVARLNGTNRYVIVSGDMEKPNGIVVNPLQGYIVWSDIGSTPKIETAHLDGNNRRIIVGSKLTHVDDLAIDYLDDLIYWVDSTQSLIERVRPDGTDRQVVFSNPLSNQAPQHHLVSIAVHKDHLYVADSVYQQGSIMRIHKNSTADLRIIQQHLGDGIRDIAIFAEQPLPDPEENPCVIDNGGCQDLCLFSGERGKKHCICSHAKLKPDGLTCQPYDTFILFSKLSQIDSLHILDDEHFNNSPYPPITFEGRSNIISLTVDYDAQRVIYSEITRDQICSIFFNGTDKRVLVEKQSFVEGIAFANNQLYWTSIHDNSISRLNTTSTGVLSKTCQDTSLANAGASSAICKPATVEKLVALGHDDKPRGIAVDVCTNYIYWTNWNNDASIQRAGPQTNYEVESIITTNIKVPNGIAIDQKRRKLYWCDAKLDKIETCDMDGTNRVVLVSASPQHPFALAIWKNNVFWTDWVARSVLRADKYTGQQVVQIRKVVQRPMGIAVAAGDMHECPADSCAVNNGGCPPNYVCLMYETSSGQSHIKCREPDELSHDLVLPAPKCRHMGNSKVCDYHDVIMDNLDRITPDLEGILTNYNGNNAAPIGGLPSLSPIYPQYMTTGAPLPPPSPASSSPPARRTQPSQISSKIRPFNIGNRQASASQTASQAASTSFIQTTASSSQIAAAVSLNSTNPSLPPCQISPAPLQPTTGAGNQVVTSSEPHNGSLECNGQFKCYLSEHLLCVARERRCDGNFDCPSKEDENDCYLSSRGQYNLKHDTNWPRFVTVIFVILAAALAALFLVFGSTRGRRRWFVSSVSGFSNHEMFDDENGTNIEISNPMFDDDDSANLVHCAFSIDLNERTTNFSNPLYERQVLLVNDKNPSTNPSA